MFKITLNFESDGVDSIECINQLLSGLPLSNIAIEDGEGYRKTVIQRSDGKIVAVDRSYCYDKLTLCCEKAENEEKYVYQMYTVLVDEDEADDYINKWRSEHPDRCMRLCIKTDYSDGDSTFVILHHEKLNTDDAEDDE